jgi:hypothetical protein
VELPSVASRYQSVGWLRRTVAAETGADDNS